jgi:hypothetical protein
MRTTRHPDRLRRRKFLASLYLVASILASQTSESLSRQIGNRQPCQKSPSTNTATCRSRNTKSGRPGKSGAWLSQTSPASESNLAISRSGPVSFPLMRDITRLRVSTDIMSPRCLRRLCFRAAPLVLLFRMTVSFLFDIFLSDMLGLGKLSVLHAV